MKTPNKTTPLTQYFRFPLNWGGLRGSFWFTLVELIVVISILAILWTIAFLSFWWYSSKARDWSRISDTMSLSKWIELYSVKSGYYPKPEWTLTEWIINWTVVAYKWEIQDQISSLAKISKTPKDPLSNNYYIYWTTLDLKQYQIATTLENSLAYNNPITQTTYADWPTYQAKVTWNYKWLIKYKDLASQTWLSNIPSLIYNSWANLLDVNTYYSTDKSNNLPYKIQNAVTDNKKADVVIKEITNNQNATLTWISLSWITTKEQVQANSSTFTSLWFDTSTIEKVVVNWGTVVGMSGSTINTTNTTITPLIYINWNDAYINRWTNTSAKLWTVDITWDSSKKWWKRTSDNAILVPDKTVNFKSSIIEWTWTTVAYIASAVAETNFNKDQTNNLFVSPAVVPWFNYCTLLNTTYAWACNADTVNFTLNPRFEYAWNTNTSSATYNWTQAYAWEEQFSVWLIADKSITKKITQTYNQFASHQSYNSNTSYCEMTYWTGWRMPTDYEVWHINDSLGAQGWNPAYAGSSSAEYFWTVSRARDYTSKRQIVNLGTGLWNWNPLDVSSNRVRCVFSPGN